MTAQSDGALHVALERQYARDAGTPRAASSCTPNFIMISGPQTIATACVGSNGAPGMSEVTTPTKPCHPVRCAVDDHLHGDVEAAAPQFDLAREQDVVRRACPEQHDDAAVPLATGEHVVKRGPERRQPDAAGQEDDIRPLDGFDRPRRAERPRRPTIAGEAMELVR